MLLLEFLLFYLEFLAAHKLPSISAWQLKVRLPEHPDLLRLNGLDEFRS